MGHNHSRIYSTKPAGAAWQAWIENNAENLQSFCLVSSDDSYILYLTKSGEFHDSNTQMTSPNVTCYKVYTDNRVYYFRRDTMKLYVSGGSSYDCRLRNWSYGENC